MTRLLVLPLLRDDCSMYLLYESYYYCNRQKGIQHGFNKGDDLAGRGRT